MKSVKYITNEKGERDGIFIDLKSLRRQIKKKDELIELFEDIEDIVAIELSKNEKSVPYNQVRKQLLKRK